MRCDRILILAAGRASRMKRSAEQAAGKSSFSPLEFGQDALVRPKPMIRIGPEGEPLLQFILEQALRAGFTEATIVLAPDDALTKPFVAHWNGAAGGLKMKVGWAVQSEPKGTAHAVQCALEQDPVGGGKAFVLCNGDNVPTRNSLAKLRCQPQGQAVLAYDSKHLGLAPEKTKAFAILESRNKHLVSIVEKPSQEQVDQHQYAHGCVRVSMNLFRLDGSSLLPFLKSLDPHPLRGELELPSALQLMLQSGGIIEMIEVADAVLDLTRLTDVQQLQRGLTILEPFELEVCATTPEDVRIAMEAGAQRVELCSHWPCGGLTSPESDIRLAASIGIPVHALVRPRAGHFHYSESEKSWMTDQIEASLEAGAVRAVVGGLNAEARLDCDQLESWADRFGAHRLVVHRALDVSAHWKADVEALLGTGISRLLSSGGSEKALDGKDWIKWALEFGFEITVGSGVRPEQLKEWQENGVWSFHASCRREEIRRTRHFDGTVHPVASDEVHRWFS